MRDLTDKELKYIIESGKCPFCDSTEFYEGPSGGICTNIECAECEAKYNVNPLGLRFELIGEPNGIYPNCHLNQQTADNIIDKFKAVPARVGRFLMRKFDLDIQEEAMIPIKQHPSIVDVEDRRKWKKCRDCGRGMGPQYDPTGHATVHNDCAPR